MILCIWVHVETFIDASCSQESKQVLKQANKPKNYINGDMAKRTYEPRGHQKGLLMTKAGIVSAKR